MANKMRRLSTIISLMVILSMLLAACGGGTESPTATPGTGTGEATQAPAGDATATQAPAGEATNTTAPSGGNTGGNTGGPKMKDANTLNVGTSADPESLDPAWEYDTASATVVFNVYETLVAMNKEKTS